MGTLGILSIVLTVEFPLGPHLGTYPNERRIRKITLLSLPDLSLADARSILSGFTKLNPAIADMRFEASWTSKVNLLGE